MTRVKRVVYSNAPVQVSDGDYLSSDEVVEPVDGAGVDEAVSHPQTCLYDLLDLTLDLHTHTHAHKVVSVLFTSESLAQVLGTKFSLVTTGNRWTNECANKKD